ncbi:MAG: outer membrane protein assembly factor BamB, partial [Candidatus Paceibacteria bacterium]
LYGSIDPVQDESEFRFQLHCLDKSTGDELWSRVCWEGVPSVKRHPKGSHAASSPAVDGEHVLAFFGGEGLYCYDLEGELLWDRDLGPMDSGYYVVPEAQWGFGSSPLLHEGFAIVQCDKQEGSFIAALDASNGEERWRTERDDVPTWSTPTVLVGESGSQVICNGYKHAGGYDLETGAELWNLVGGGDIPVPTPIVSKGLIFITNAHGGMAPIFALNASARGEIGLKPEEEPLLAWAKPRRGNYMQTPLAYGDAIYFCTDSGIMSSFDTQTGEENYRERLGEGRTGFTSSPVAANGNIYYSSEEGNVYVVQLGEFKPLAVNFLGEECMATPAISDGVLYYRTRSHVVAIGF